MAITVTVRDDTTIYDATEAMHAQYVAARVYPRACSTVYSGDPSFWGRAVKRVLDTVLAGIALLVLAPIMLLIMVLVCVSSPGLPWFGQERLGQYGQGFRCWKFRSMRRDAEATLRQDPKLYARYIANDFKLDCDDDPRITAIGRLLRKTSLDELPQLINVLFGQMSLVGPRPVVAFELERCYGPWSAEYLAVRPGLTGPWQISGRNDIRYPERAALDAYYVHTWSLRQDLGILARTPMALIRKVGVA